MMRVNYFLILVCVCSLVSCSSDDGDSSSEGYDRGAMLTNWADNIIVPAYTDYQQKVNALSQAATTFASERTEANLTALREAWQSTYLSWQWVAMFEIGRAESLGLQGYTNTFPTDATEIESNINSGSYNLELPSRKNQQGLPALDYLLYGLGADKSAVITAFENSEGHRTYLTDLTDRLKDLTDQVVEDWDQSYRDSFVDNDGSSATASVNKLANDFMFAYEKILRADKIGTPAGHWSGTAAPESVEAFYVANFSKSLYTESLMAMKDFFNGKHFGKAQTGESFAGYLDYMQSITDADDLTQTINDQFAAIDEANQSLSESFSSQIESDNASMLDVFDELQKNVVYFKSDMFSRLSIAVDYQDSDGD